ncbi:MAG TPA: hypothetical protein DET40_25960 [Lentisphaeria bacterium]|nr:MAG: hypothetical protein A2X45_15055 [Lentisphaerae bacterium GWF2_50_93]HCE47008.1 hypothetical protein [Lentisphaeria bacterium]
MASRAHKQPQDTSEPVSVPIFIGINDPCKFIRGWKFEVECSMFKERRRTSTLLSTSLAGNVIIDAWQADRVRTDCNSNGELFVVKPARAVPLFCSEFGAWIF